ncbi:MAG TPA: DPP IV N-terminal domain-containing protein [Pyrinomonadaceae bacterium]|nr:DPP IV N-terminal domain-containing protein [Pyrinomonadaceae bacterium]
MQNRLGTSSLCILLTLMLMFSSTVASSGRVYLQQPDVPTTNLDPVSLMAVIPGVPHGVAMTSNRDGNNEVYVMDANGGDQSRVTDNVMNTSNDQRPDISPDGKQIVFSSNRDGNFEIFIMNSDGSDVIQLTSTSAPTSNSWPRWSPDGEWIAFQSGAGTNFQIYRIRPDGSGLTQVTNYVGINQFPAWSPDGTRLAIRRDTEIYLIDSADGSHPVRLTLTDSIPGVFNQMASFSPDGKKIAYLSNNRDNPGDPLYLSVYIMDSDGNNKVNFTPKAVGYAGTWTSRAPAWAPNGQYIYFTAVRSFTAGSLEQIFVKPTGGGDETQLTFVGANSEATVRRIYAPTITSVTATPDVLWPSNNNMMPVSLAVDVNDNSDPAPVCLITDVTSNEVAAETAWQITGPLTLDLRAQRFGMGLGRIYTIRVTCTNSSQLNSSANVTVKVPHDQRQ